MIKTVYRYLCWGGELKRIKIWIFHKNRNKTFNIIYSEKVHIITIKKYTYNKLVYAHCIMIQFSCHNIDGFKPHDVLISLNVYNSVGGVML